jgi:hypothetical protein
MIVLDLHAEFFKTRRHRRRRPVAAGHRVAVRQEQLGQSAHAGAADPDEVYCLMEVLHSDLFPLPPATGA